MIYGLTPKEAFGRRLLSAAAAGAEPQLWHQLAAPTTGPAGLVVVRLCNAVEAVGLVILTEDDARQLGQDLILQAEHAMTSKAVAK